MLLMVNKDEYIKVREDRNGSHMYEGMLDNRPIFRFSVDFNQSLKMPYPTRERERPHKQIFETPVYRLSSGPSPVLSLLSIQRGRQTILSVGLPVS